MKIAIVGSGISGLSALWAIKKYSDHEVELFERRDRLGGDAYAVPYQIPGKKECQVDLAFLLFNHRGWPNLCKFFKELGVETQDARATFSVSGDEGRYEWSSHSLSTVFRTWANMANPNMWRMIWDVVRFSYFAPDILRDPETYRNVSLSDYLRTNNYSRAFAELYLIPLVAAVWTGKLRKCADMPVLKAIQVFHANGMLELWEKIPWQVVKGGSGEYIKKIVKCAPEGSIHMNLGVQSARPTPDGQVALKLDDGTTRLFDHVIIASPTEPVRRILGAGHCLSSELDYALSQSVWTDMELVAHHDQSLLPRDPKMWAGWNATLFSESQSEKSPSYMIPTEARPVANTISCCFSYNEMLGVPESEYGPVLVSFNPQAPIDPSKIIYRHVFSQGTPMLSSTDAIQNLSNPKWCEKHIPKGIDLCGAWKGYGYHEDGLVSSFQALQKLSINVPEMLPRSNPPRALSTSDNVARALIVTFEYARIVLTPLTTVLAWIIIALCNLCMIVCEMLDTDKAKHDIELVRDAWAEPDTYQWAT
ncbi:hypothetical protein BD324DRAFT_150487 [Kockovaella imperatae]|uniref:Amine oxidase domain-containing protein n=1 Tax=Kockovaella imperatae TaxID=4999 RepID=A0A1Y1U8U5_9TREE|nr:hypothetical protein BD324DRAFT_150487 [Kockovaella imperatae]ORX34438.1 hypothetical protein BD324DRAFT_150487 [Kockovaella imperatae]